MIINNIIEAILIAIKDQTGVEIWKATGDGDFLEINTVGVRYEQDDDRDGRGLHNLMLDAKPVKYREKCHAIIKLPCENELADIAKNNSSTDVRSIAINNITDSNVLIEIAMSDKESKIRNQALNRVSDLPVLLKVAKDSNDIEFLEDAYFYLKRNDFEAASKNILNIICIKASQIYCKDPDSLSKHTYSNIETPYICTRCGYEDQISKQNCKHAYSDDENDYTCTLCGYENVRSKRYCNVHGLEPLMTQVTRFLVLRAVAPVLESYILSPSVTSGSSGPTAILS